jgi:hypothetical protein
MSDSVINGVVTSTVRESMNLDLNSPSNRDYTSQTGDNFLMNRKRRKAISLRSNFKLKARDRPFDSTLTVTRQFFLNTKNVSLIFYRNTNCKFYELVIQMRLNIYLQKSTIKMKKRILKSYVRTLGLFMHFGNNNLIKIKCKRLNFNHKLNFSLT